MIFEIGDIVRVPIAHVERVRMTVRPAVVIARQSTPVGDLCWVLMITNALRPAWPGDVPISGHDEHGLPIPSKVRTSKIATVTATEASRLGRLHPSDLDAVREMVRVTMRELLTTV